MCVCVCESHNLHTFHRRRSEKNKGKSFVCVWVSQMAGDVQQGSYHRHHLHVVLPHFVFTRSVYYLNILETENRQHKREQNEQKEVNSASQSVGSQPPVHRFVVKN